MARRRLHPAAMLVTALLIVSAWPRPVRAAGDTGAPRAKAGTASAEGFSVKSGTCKDFLALPDSLRGLVVAWTAGRYHTLERWVLDEATATKVVAAVEQACQKTPEASFRYQVVGEIKKLR